MKIIMDSQKTLGVLVIDLKCLTCLTESALFETYGDLTTYDLDDFFSIRLVTIFYINKNFVRKL